MTHRADGEVMTLDAGDIVFEKLPSIAGLVLVAFTLFVLSRHWADMRSSIRGWATLAFTSSLAGFWAAELVRDAAGGLLQDEHIAVDVTFIAASMWLGLIMAATGMTYRRFSTVAGFRRWMVNRPLNIVTVMGVAALILAVYTWAVRPSAGGESEAAVIVLTAGYLVVWTALLSWMGVAAVRNRARSGATPTLDTGVSPMIAAWMGPPITVFALHVVAGERLGLEDYNPYGWIMLLLFILILRSYTAKEFTTIVVDPVIEDTKRSGFRVYDIPRGVYLLEDDRSHSAFALFSELVTLPLTPDAAIPRKEEGSATATLEYLIPRGLIVTRTFPEAIRKDHDIHVTPIIWLTESPGERRIAPTSVAVLTDTMTRFMEANPNSIVLLEGVEYLVTFNDFKRVLKALDSLNETTWVTRTRLIVSLDPKAFDPKDLALLERDRKVLRGQKDVDTLKKESRATLPEG